MADETFDPKLLEEQLRAAREVVASLPNCGMEKLTDEERERIANIILQVAIMNRQQGRKEAEQACVDYLQALREMREGVKDHA